jgi:eukaryotic-like serine/threonine-protein kinase
MAGSKSRKTERHSFALRLGNPRHNQAPAMLSSGSRLGGYEIVSALGVGGMGEVYRARDTKLHREVAIKLLPEAFRSDPDRLARFGREARSLAAINHPNIAAIYEVEEQPAFNALILELVEGATLAERLAGVKPRGAGLPVAEALTIARQIVDALEAAHERGIVHRDLKPANIKITPEGVVKVLDFGLAKAAEDDGAGQDGSESPTMPGAATSPGLILGTAAYMSPEQARGLPVDERTDIWAFGCVVYEMLTGRAPFGGATASDTIAAILHHEPDWSLLPATTPPGIRRAIRRCLQPDQRLRRQDIGDVRIDFDEGLAGSTDDVTSPISRARGTIWVPWLLAGLASLAAGAIWYTRSTVQPGAETQLEIMTPPTSDAVSLAVSPDGTTVVFVATSNDQPQLWQRSFASRGARPMAGTEGASYPFWSFDGKSIGFFAEGRLKRIELESGSTKALTYVQFPSGGAWGAGGVILFAPGAGQPISRIPETGGDAVPVARIDAPQQSNLRAPHFLPDGHHFLYYATGTPDGRGVYLGDLSGGASHRVLDADSSAVYASSGHLLFVRQGKLYAQSFDVRRLMVSGSPFLVADEIAVDGVNIAAISTSTAGPIVYRLGLLRALRRFVWLDRQGHEIEGVGQPDSTSPFSPTLSPDGRRAVLYRTVDGNADIWTLDTTRGVLSRLTFDAVNELNPIWSADGKRIIFGVNRKGRFDIVQKGADGPAGEEMLLETPETKAPTDSSRDGRYLLYRTIHANNGYDLWAMPSGGKPFPVAQSRFDEREGQFSPDGQWVAYQSNESGRFEIYLQSFPDPKTKVQVSANGGAQVRWRRDGKEMFYVALDGRLMSIPILGTSPERVETGPPVPLFLTHIGGAIGGPQKQQYDVSLDGQRFLMNTVVQASPPPISVTLNWKPKS